MEKNVKQNRVSIAVEGEAFDQALVLKQKRELECKQIVGIATIVREALAEMYEREFGEKAKKEEGK